MTNAIRILIADDNAVVHEGLQAMLATQPDLEVVGAARDGVEAVALAYDLQPQVILMDLVMPRLDGLQAIRQIRARNQDARILLITSFADDERVFLAIKAGAMGYLLKDTLREQLYQAIRDVAGGQAVLHPTIAFKVIQEISQPLDRPAATDPLTPREVETLHLVAQGLSDEEIAAKMGVETRMVAQIGSSILHKLHLADTTHCAL
jgi:two-component system, NarL family, response regulator LiaR